ncbi:hypothetical protein [Teichococcus aestuarii]
MLDDVAEAGEVRRMSSAAFLKIGAMHGVTVEIEPPLGADGDVPLLVRQGLVIRCMLPRGISAAWLAAALAEGPVAQLVQKVLDGHRLNLTADGGTGQLSRGAELARSRLLETLSAMSPLLPAMAPTRSRRPRKAPLQLAAA